jgi:hypothetical protein
MENMHLFPAAFFTEDVPPEEYMRRIAVPNNRCDHVEIIITAEILGWHFHVFNGTTTTDVTPWNDVLTHSITLLYSSNLAVPAPAAALPSPDASAPPHAFSCATRLGCVPCVAGLAVFLGPPRRGASCPAV